MQLWPWTSLHTLHACSCTLIYTQFLYLKVTFLFAKNADFDWSEVSRDYFQWGMYYSENLISTTGFRNDPDKVLLFLESVLGLVQLLTHLILCRPQNSKLARKRVSIFIDSVLGLVHYPSVRISRLIKQHLHIGFSNRNPHTSHDMTHKLHYHIYTQSLIRKHRL